MRAALALVAAATLAGCSAAPAGAVSDLDGTRWQLTEIQSMDDAQGATTVPAGQSYIVEFGPREDGVGRAALQIDCNRGFSTWQADAAAAADSSGELTFGPIAATEMACSPGSLDQRVSNALGDVRTYLVQDGRLHLSLFADAGILTWEQVN